MTMGVTTRETEPAKTHVRVLDGSLMFAEALARALGRFGLDAVGEALDRLPDAVATLSRNEPWGSPGHATVPQRLTPSLADEPNLVLLVDADDVAGLYWHAAGLSTCRAPVVLIAASVTPRLRLVARRLGAKAVLTREARLEDLAAALVAVAGGDSHDLATASGIGAGGRAGQNLPAAGPPVTERQRQILSLMALGEPNDSIASRLGLSPHTVRTHVQNLLARLGVNSRLAAVVSARELDLIDLVPSTSAVARTRR